MVHQFKKTHRKYPGVSWDYRAISKIVDGKEVVYYKFKNKGKKIEGVEVFQGANYVPPFKGRSYSRSYKMREVPKKYKDLVKKLKNKYQKTKWSKKKKVDLN